MTPTLGIIAIVCILAGLLMVAFSPKATYQPIVMAVFWIGIVLIVVGAVLILTPVFVWLSAQFRQMFGL